MVEQTVSFASIIEWLNTNSGALTVIITLVYVVATVLIWIANYKSAQATHDQLEESKRQFEETKRANQQQLEAMRLQLEESKRQYAETKRLEIMPYIQFERSGIEGDLKLTFALNSGGMLTGKVIQNIRMKNTGNGTAKNITYTYQWDNLTKSRYRGAFPIQALSSGESQILNFDFAYLPDGKNTVARFILRYEDLLENVYTQQFQLKFNSSDMRVLRLSELTTSSPDFEPKETTHA